MGAQKFADVEVSRVSDAKASLESYLRARGAEVLKKIVERKAFDDELDAEMKAACTEWRKTFA